MKAYNYLQILFLVIAITKNTFWNGFYSQKKISAFLMYLSCLLAIWIESYAKEMPVLFL